MPYIITYINVYVQICYYSVYYCYVIVMLLLSFSPGNSHIAKAGVQHTWDLCVRGWGHDTVKITKLHNVLTAVVMETTASDGNLCVCTTCNIADHHVLQCASWYGCEHKIILLSYYGDITYYIRNSLIENKNWKITLPHWILQ